VAAGTNRPALGRGTGEQFPPKGAANIALWAQEEVWRSGSGKEFLTPAPFIMIVRRGEELLGEASDSHKVHIKEMAFYNTFAKISVKVSV